MNKAFKYLFDSNYRFLVNNALGFYKKMDDRKFIEKLFYVETGKKPNLDNPTTFDEKLQWLKLYDRNPTYVDLVDKFKSKEILAAIIGEKYILTPLGCWNSFDEIDFNKLPEKFILKTTHDSGTHCICVNKETFNYKKAKKKLEKSLKRNYYYLWREWPYKDVKPRIIAEPLLQNKDESPLVDYKFYCYGGKPQYFMYSIGEAEHNVKNIKIDLNGNSIDYLFKEKPALDINNIELPENFKEMIVIVMKLSNISQHVRIDLFNVDGKIYMGEVTFCTNAGFIHIRNEDYKQSLADLIDITKAYNYAESEH